MKKTQHQHYLTDPHFEKIHCSRARSTSIPSAVTSAPTFNWTKTGPASIATQKRVAIEEVACLDKIKDRLRSLDPRLPKARKVWEIIDSINILDDIATVMASSGTWSDGELQAFHGEMEDCRKSLETSAGLRRLLDGTNDMRPCQQSQKRARSTDDEDPSRLRPVKRPARSASEQLVEMVEVVLESEAHAPELCQGHGKSDNRETFWWMEPYYD